jgi:hypothetical protein
MRFQISDSDVQDASWHTRKKAMRLMFLFNLVFTFRFSVCNVRIYSFLPLFKNACFRFLLT